MILTYTQNRKLANLGKCSFTSSFDSSCNLRCKNDKKLTEAKTYRSSYASRRKIENFRGFRVFEFNLYPISKTQKSRSVSFYFKFWQSLQKQQKNKWGKIFLRYAFSRKKKDSRGFRVFDFDLYPKSKTRKSGKVFLTVVATEDAKTTKKLTEAIT